MELCGIAIAAFLGLFLAPLYCLLLEKIIARFKHISQFLFWVSCLFILLFTLEYIFVLQNGPVETRNNFGKWFFTVHALITFAIAPSAGASLLLNNVTKGSLKWYFVAPICWLIGITAIFYQYYIAESLYGPDGIGGPFTWPW